MQTVFKIFDFSAQGQFAPVDKIAVRLPASPGADSQRAVTDFMGIMDKMLQLDPEQVQASLRQFETVALEGSADGETAPLIDLSGQGAQRQDLLALLMGHADVQDASLEMDDEDGPLHGGCGHTCGQEEGAFSGQGALGHIRLSTEPLTSGNLPAGNAAAGQGVTPAAAAATGAEMPAPPVAAAQAGSQAMPNPLPEMQPVPSTPLDGQTAGKLNANGQQPPAPHNNGQQPPAPSAATQAPVQPADAAAATVSALQGEPDTTSTPLQRTGIAQPAQPSQSAQPSAATAAEGLKPLAEAGLGQQPQPVPERRVLKERVQVAAASPSSNDNPGTGGEADETAGALKRSGTEASEAQPRLTAARDGLQTMTQGAGSRGAPAAETLAADRGASAPSKELQNDVMRQIVQRMTLNTRGTQSSMQVHLKPEFLGNVHMQISTDHQQVVVRMTAESMAVKEMIEQHLSFLRAELHHHGLEIDKFDVFVGNDSEGWKSSQDPSGFRQALKNGQQDPAGRNRGAASEQQDDESADTPSNRPSHAGEIDYFA